VPEYRIYCVDDQNRIVSRHDAVVADDLAALEKAKELCEKYEVEVWERERFVTRVAKDGTASLKPVSGPRTTV
jgi:hypothetical protein